MKSIVVAVGRNNEIGADNDMPWARSLKDDLANFKRLTLGKSVIMGRKTFDSIGRPLPDRQNIVVTRRGPVGVKGVLSCGSLEAAYAMAQYDIVIAGGGQIYKESLEDMNRLYVTEVDAEFPDATVFFPAIDPAIWKEVSREHHKADERNAFAFDFVEYERMTMNR